MPKVLIIGGGEGGALLLPILNEDKNIEILGVADIKTDAPAIFKARELGIPTSDSYKELLKTCSPEVIINVTGSREISDDLYQRKEAHTEILGGLSANLLFKLVDERRKSEEQISRSLQEQHMLYDIGIMLSSSDKQEDMLLTIIQYAMRLTDMPAGSITLYNETTGKMELMASVGFSDSFTTKTSWDIEKGGLSDHILNEGKTVAIKNIKELIKVDRPALEAENIKSLLATPLIAERKTIGILYVDDFEEREFTPKDESIIALLATQAAAAIEKLQLLEKTRKLAITDELTTLHNHRHFVHLLTEELKRAKRYSRPLSVMLIDIDHFKHYNDTNGHIEGNDVLKDVAAAMLQSIRDIDILARYGGEEFAVILPEADKAETGKCAERVRKAIEGKKFANQEKQPLGNLTVSIGYSTYPEDAKMQRSLLNRADIALYKAKEEGRNKAIAFRQ
ncbi:MAG: sensor domain-containing diguanylate cyclase [Deltaproteobacteria bacterium]|nr:sensor domain-containing diguanylate cyclase [Deltaproteobacteria bacterium]